MALPWGTKCIKFLLFAFCLLFVVSGIILIAVGSVIKTPYSAYQYKFDHGFFAIPVLLICVGIIIFIVSSFGCCGALKENYCLTITFGVLLVVIFILEISGGIAGYVLKDKVSSTLKKDLSESMLYYDNNASDHTKQIYTNMWNLAQSSFHCCGATSPSDWEKLNLSLPKTCCQSENDPCTLTRAYNESCYSSLENLFTSNAGTLGGAGIGIAIIQILGILCSYSLATSIAKQYETLEKD